MSLPLPSILFQALLPPNKILEDKFYNFVVLLAIKPTQIGFLCILITCINDLLLFRSSVEPRGGSSSVAAESTIFLLTGKFLKSKQRYSEFRKLRRVNSILKL